MIFMSFVVTELVRLFTMKNTKFMKVSPTAVDTETELSTSS